MSQSDWLSVDARSRSDGLQNDARTAAQVNPRNSAGEKPSCAAIAYSRPIVVQARTGSSVRMATGMPCSTKRRTGWLS